MEKLKVKILGTGCKKCNKLEENVKEALESLNVEYDIDHITEIKDIATYGVMMTPALVVNEKVLSYGKVLKPKDIVAMLKKR